MLKHCIASLGALMLSTTALAAEPELLHEGQDSVHNRVTGC